MVDSITNMWVSSVQFHHMDHCLRCQGVKVNNKASS